MAHQSALIAEDIEAYLKEHEDKDVLRFITCGSVDDGKSTLIGRLLYESKMIFDDQLASLTNDSKKFGTTGEDLDLALLVDGLAAEREQGITIDVAYRFFSTSKRKFIVADTPGHEQFVRNMATGASTAQLAIVIIDAQKGVLPQARRHSIIVSMMGVKHVILAVNKMDAVGYKEETFKAIEAEYKELAKALGITHVHTMPVSALRGDNIVTPSPKMPWYKGDGLMHLLETVDVSDINKSSAFRMPVQWVNRPSAGFRGFSGRIVSGTIAPGAAVKVLPSGKQSCVARIVTFGGDLNIAEAGQSVTLTLVDELDISRGDVLALADNACEVADRFEVKILWMAEAEMLTSRQYLMQCGTASALCTPVNLKYAVDVNTLEHKPCKTLHLNEVGVCDMTLNRMIPFEPYAMNRELGSFILIDRLTNETVGAGMINHALRRSANVHRENLTINQQARAALKDQKPCVIWLTGLSGAGKTTLANLVEQKLYARGKHTMLLDGDNVRHGLNQDLGFTDRDRTENIRRIAEVSKLMTEAGLITLVSFISPFRAERQMAKELIGADNFIEIHVDVSLEVAEQRDVKGLYKKARAGQIPNFTGINSPYEAPETPDLRVNTSQSPKEELVESIISLLIDRGFLTGIN